MSSFVRSTRWSTLAFTLALSCASAPLAHAATLGDAYPATWARRWSVELNGSPVGTVEATVAERDADTILFRTEVKLTVKSAGQDVETVLVAKQRVATADLLPRSYELTAMAGGALQATITAEFPSGKDPQVRTVSGPIDTTVSIPNATGARIIDNNFVLDGYEHEIRALALADGASADVAVIVPQVAMRLPQAIHMKVERKGTEAVTVGGVSRDAILHVVTADPGLVIRVLTDKADGALLRLEVPAQQSVATLMPPGAQAPTTTAFDAEQATQAALAKITVPAGVDLGDANTLARLRLAIAVPFAVFSGVSALDRPTQRLDGTVEASSAGATRIARGNLELRAVTYDPASGKAFLADACAGAAAPWRAPSEGADPATLRPDPNVASDAPEIVALAKEIAGASRTPWDKTRALATWVFANVRYEITGSDARTALRDRKGDCGPKSLLLASLCRAAGVPARVVGGLLYFNRAFGQHSWVEVFLPDVGWMPVDPTTGEVGTFSASHVTLWEGYGMIAPDVAPVKLEVLGFDRMSAGPAP